MSENHVTYSAHKTVVVKFGQLSEDIDVEIALLIEQIWKAGISTMMTCQETDPGIAWIDSIRFD